MTMASDDKSLKLERISSKRMLIILRDYSSMEKNTTRALQKIRENIREYQETQQLISEEEAIFAASVGSPALQEKVQTSGNVEHDELFRTLEQAKRLQKEAARDLMSEQIQLLKTRKQLAKVRLSIRRLDSDDSEFVSAYLISGMPADEGMQKACLGKAGFYRKATRIAAKLTVIYNEDLENGTPEEECPSIDGISAEELWPEEEKWADDGQSAPDDIHDKNDILK